jgi:cell division transport system permease protein
MFWHAFREGMKHVLRSFWLSATAVSVLTVSLGSVLLVASISTIIGSSLRQFDSQISIIAYFKDDISKADKDKSIEEFKDIRNVKKVDYINNTEAKVRLSKSSKSANSLIQSLTDSNIDVNLEFLEIFPNSSEDFDTVQKSIKNSPSSKFFSEFLSTQDLAKKLREIYKYIQLGLVLIITIFGLISVLVIANILRITVYNLREEIEIMRLVGATNNYIVSPFLAQSAIFTVLANLILGIIYFPITTLLIPSIKTWVNVTGVNDIQLLPQFVGIYLLISFISLVAGVLISFISTKRYLNL